MLEKVGGKRMRGIIFPLVLLIGAMFALPLGATYNPPDRNQNLLPDHIDMMHGIWTITPLPYGDFDADGIPDVMEDTNANGVFEPHIGETDPQNLDTDGDGIIDGAEFMGNATWLPSPMDPTVVGTHQDADGDGVPNALDLDSDNDGLLDGHFAAVGNPLLHPSGSYLSFNQPGSGTFRYEVGDVGTDPYNPDHDGDGILDGDEVYTYLTNPLLTDSDGDGINDSLEVAYGTNPNSTDSDGDGITDSLEWRLDGNLVIGPPDDHDGDNMYNVLDLDSDNDGIYDGVTPGPPATASEDTTDTDGDGIPNYLDMDSDNCGIADGSELYLFVTDPYSATADGDLDGVPDEMEIAFRTNPGFPDTDGDGIPDGIEWVGDTTSSLLPVACGIPPDDYDADSIPNARDMDSDNDGVADGAELSFTGTAMAAYNPDFDGDGLCDGFEYGNDLNLEVATGVDTTSMRNPDSDGDGINDYDEVVVWKTDPLLTDTDGDGLDDSTEIYQDLSDTDGDYDNDGINNAIDRDSDNDGVPDALEYYGAPPYPTSLVYNADTDGDGLLDGFERNVDLNKWTVAKDTTNPISSDTDNDGIDDSTEVVQGLSPINPNTDGDSIFVVYVMMGSTPTLVNRWYNIYEGPIENYPAITGTIVCNPTPPTRYVVFNQPTVNDWNNDGDTDDAVDTGYVEVMTSDHDSIGMDDPLDPIWTDYGEFSDTDKDGLPDILEAQIGTDPYAQDTDGDGAWDGDELYPQLIDVDPIPNAVNPAAGYWSAGTWIGAWYSSDPRIADTDGDGLVDGFIDNNGDCLYEFASGDVPGELTMGWYTCNFTDTIPRQSSGSLKRGKAIDLRADFRATNPRNSDTDGDTLFDGWAYSDSAESDKWHINADSVFVLFWTYRENYGDPDADGVMNALDLDSDGDGTTDFQEYKATRFPLTVGFFGSTNPGAEPLLDSVLTKIGRIPMSSHATFSFMWDFGNNTINNAYYWTGNSDHIIGLSPSDPDNEPDQDEIEGFWKNGGSDSYNPCKGTKHVDYSPLDGDADGLLDGLEDLEGSFRAFKDSDADGLWDGDEVLPVGVVSGWAPRRTDPTNRDTDGDGLSDSLERNAISPLAITVQHWTDPLMRDTDGDSTAICGLDGQEDANGNGAVDGGETDPRNPDTDGDLTPDCSDASPLVVEDTDYDGLFDFWELYFVHSNPRDQDTDNDGMADGWYDVSHDTVVDPAELLGELGDVDIYWDTSVIPHMWVMHTHPTGLGSFPYTVGYNKFTEPGIDTLFFYNFTLARIDTLAFPVTALTGTDTDFDGLQDGTELGLGETNAAQLTDDGLGPTAADQTDDAIFIPDADQGAGEAGDTTNPFTAHSDADWLFDGIQEDYEGATATDPGGGDTWQGGNRGNGAISGDNWAGGWQNGIWNSGGILVFPPTEYWTETDPIDPNTDGDYLRDDADWAFCAAYGAALDADWDDDALRDGHSTGAVWQRYGEWDNRIVTQDYNTSPVMKDTDIDSLNDGQEIGNIQAVATGPVNFSLGGGIINFTGHPAPPVGSSLCWHDNDMGNTRTDPINRDSDGDGLVDGFGEDVDQTGRVSGDTDNDGILDLPGEFWAETNPAPDIGSGFDGVDSDQDGVVDGYNGWETITANSDAPARPNAVDRTSDNDIVSGVGGTDLEDGWETFAGGNIANAAYAGGNPAGITLLNHFATSPYLATALGTLPATWVGGPTIAWYHDTDGDQRSDGVNDNGNNTVNPGEESPFIDAEPGGGDGISDASDVDSDDDWLLDGDGTLWGTAYPFYPGTGEDNGSGAGNPNDGIVGGTETDPNAPEDADGDGLPDWVEISFQSNPLDDDTDDDGLADRYCLGSFAPLVPILYNLYGGLIIGEEEVSGVATAYGTPGFFNYYTLDPRNIDTDADSIQDGTEVMVSSWVAGTNLAIVVFDAQPNTFTNPYDADTDNDGLPDGTSLGEDLPTVPTVGVWGDGMIAGDFFIIPGVFEFPMEIWTETDPNDTDTDEDGLVDGWEVHWLAPTFPLVWDTDSDLLSDGLEWHVPLRPVVPIPGPLVPQLWLVWNANIGNGANNGPGATYAQDTDLGSMTDPFQIDTDFDLRIDGGTPPAPGGEDFDHNGAWNWVPIVSQDPVSLRWYTGNPYIWPGADGAPVESNPLDRDSDHGGRPDNLDIPPPGQKQPTIPRRYDGLWEIPNEGSRPDGDYSYEILPLPFPYPAGIDTTLNSGRDSLFIDPVPGDSGTAMFEIFNNEGASLDDIFTTCTDLDWAYDVPTYTVPAVGLWPDTLVIPFDSVDIWGIDEGVKIGPFPIPAPIITSTGGPPNNGLPDLPGPFQDMDSIYIRVHVPWGQIPGIYEGRLVIWQGDPFFNNPIDTIVFQVEVDPVWEADILNNDSLPDGVGFSDPDSTGAFDNEMHLAGPLTASPPDTIIGVFLKSDPNTRPDVDVNYINDVNGLPALPQYPASPSAFYPFEWDTLDLYGTLDWQGNTTLDSVFVGYQFLSYTGPGFVTADSVDWRVFFNHDGVQDTLLLIDTIDLGEWDSVLVKIYPYCLPPGDYYGWVYMWKDFDGNNTYNGPPGPFTTGGGTYPFAADNTTPQEADAFDAFILKFTITAPDIDIAQGEMNLDADNFMNLFAMPGDTVWGHFTVANPDQFQNYAADPWDGPSTEYADSVGVYDPDLDVLHQLPDSVWLHRISNPQDSIMAYVFGPTRLPIGAWEEGYSFEITVPVGTPFGVYTTNYSALNPVTTKPDDDFFGKILISAVGRWSHAHYIPEEPKSYQMMDWFDVRVYVGPTEAIALNPTFEVDSAYHNTFVTDVFSVINTGNADLYGIIFESTALQDYAGHMIHPDNIVFEPPQIVELLMEDTVDVVKKIIVPAGQYTGWYTGEITVKDDDAFPSAVLLCSLYVYPSYDLDIADNLQNLVGNAMSLAGDTGSVVTGKFLLVNPNADGMNVDPDPFGNADLDLSGPSAYVATDLVYGSYTIPHTQISFSGNPASLGSGTSANVSVSVAIPAGQEMGTYTGTVTVTSADGSTDDFTLNVTVGPAESIVLSGTLAKTVNHGVTAIDTFRVTNDGNADLDNIVFEVTDLDDGAGHMIPEGNVSFNPTSIGMLAMTAYVDVTVRVAVPLGTYAGTYTGTVTVKDDDGYPMRTLGISITVNPSYDLDISDYQQNLVGNTMSLAGAPGSTVEAEFLLVDPNCEAMNVDPDPFGNTDLTNLTYTLSNLSGPGPDIVPTLVSPPPSLSSGGSANITYRVVIPSDQIEGTYTGTVTVTSPGEDDSGDSFDVVLVVGPDESIDVTTPADIVTDHGTTGSSSFTVTNTGNADLDNIIFEVTNLYDGASHMIADENVSFDPTSISVLYHSGPGSVAYVDVNVYVPAGTYAETYEGTITVKDDDGYPLERVDLTVTVNPSYDLDISDYGQSLVGNTMSLAGAPGSTVEAEFLLIDPNCDGMNVDPDPFGNTDLTNLTYTLSNLSGPGPDIVPTLVSPPASLSSGGSANITYRVVIPSDQIEGTYTGTVTVTSPGEDDTGDSFDVVLVVGPDESIDVTTPADIITDHGTTGSSSFTVTNTGNTDLYNIVFEVTDLYGGSGHVIADENVSFDPTSIGTLYHSGPGSVAYIGVNVYVPAGTYADTYEGTITVKDDDGYPLVHVDLTVTVNPSYDLDISDYGQNLVGNVLSIAGAPGSTVEAKFLLIDPNCEAMNVDPDPFGNTDLTNLTYTLSNLSGPGPDIVPTLVSPPPSLSSGGSANITYRVVIPSGQIEGTYTGTVTVTSPGEDDTGDSFDVVLVVGPIEGLTMTNPPDFNADHGTVGTTSFTVTNTGNDTLDHIIFTSTNFVCGDYVINDYNVSFSPTEISLLGPGATSGTITINVFVPLGTHQGDYEATITAKDDDGYPLVTQDVELTVNYSYDLDISDNEQDLIANTLFLNELPGNSDSGLFLLINPNSDGMNVDPDPFGNADLTELTYTMTNLVGPGPDITTANLSITPMPRTLESGGSIALLYEVDIPVGQIEGLYEGMVYVTSPEEDDAGDFFDVKVIVGPVEGITMTDPPDFYADHGSIGVTGFTVTNIGNDWLDNIIFTSTDFIYGEGEHIIPSANVTFEPTEISLLGPGATSSYINIIVNVPPGTHEGYYTAVITSKDDDGYPIAIQTVGLTVNPSYDIDVADNAQDLVGNTMAIAGPPGTSPTGNFVVINPNSEAMNVDPDPFGNADLYSVDAVSTVLQHTDNPLYSIPVDCIDITISPTLISGGSEVVPVVVNIPDGQEEGVYAGTITVTGEFGDKDGVSDQFELLVQVGPEEDVDIIETVTSGSGDHGTMVDLTTFTVENTGNTDLYNLLFNTSGLESGDYFLPPEDIYLYVTNFWAPANDAVLDVLLIGETADVMAAVDVQLGQHAGTYFGFIRVIDDDGVPSDAIAVSLEVLSSYDLDIANNGGNVIGNYLTLNGNAEDVLTGEFDIYNPNSEVQNVDPDPFGNDDLVEITYTVTDLQHQTNPAAFIDASVVGVSAPTSLVSGYAATGTVTVTVPVGQEEGVYIGIVTATDVSGVTDSFMLVVIVGEELDVDIVECCTYGTGGLAGLDDLISLDQFTVVNPDESYNPDPDGPSNGDLWNLGFTASALYDGEGHMINTDMLYVRTTDYPDPTPIAEALIDYLPLGGDAWVEPWALIEAGQHAGTYLGNMGVIGEGGYPADVIQVTIEIPSYFDIDIANNAGDILGNIMTLNGQPDETITGDFDIYNPASTDQNVDADPFGNDDLGNIVYTVTDLAHTHNAFYWIMASDITIDAPSALLLGETAIGEITIEIPADAITGAYVGTVTVEDLDAGVTDEFTLIVQVGGFEDVDIVEDITTGTGDHATTVELTAFTVVNPDIEYNPDPDGPSNTPLDNLGFTATDLEDGLGHKILASNIKLAATGFFGPTPVDQAVIDLLDVGQTATVVPTVDVNAGQYAGTYTGMLRVIDDDGYPSDVIGVSVTINPAYDLDISDNEQNLVSNTMSFTNAVMGGTLEGYFRLYNPANEVQNVDPDPFGNTDLTALGWDATDLVFQTPPKRGAITDGDKIGDIIPAENIDVELPEGLIHGGAENVLVTIEVPEDILAGTYKGTITVYDAVGEVEDYFFVEVFVRIAEGIDIVEEEISGEGDHGTQVDDITFTVTNIGNVKLTGINFTATNLYDGLGNVISKDGITFVPENVAELEPEGTVPIGVTVDIPLGLYTGTYEGTITAKNSGGSVSDEVAIVITVNPSYDLDIVENVVDVGSGYMGDLCDGTFMIMSPNSQATNVDPDPFGNADLDELSYEATDLTFIGGPVKVGKSGISEYVESSGFVRGEKIDQVISSENVTVDLPSFIASGSGEEAEVAVEIPQDVAAGTYEGWVTVTGNDCVEDAILVRIVVRETEDLDIAESSVEIEYEVEHGTTEDTPDFTVFNTDLCNNPDPDGPGNTTLFGIHFVADNLFSYDGTRYIAKDNVDFEPDNIPSLTSGTSTTAHAVIHVPVGTYATTYSGLVTAVNDKGSVSDTVRVILTIAESPYFHIADNEGNLVENTMYVVGEQGTTTPPTHFVVKNPIGVGNVDLTGITSRVTDLEEEGFVIEFFPRTYDVEYGGYTIGELTVTIPEMKPEGVYYGWVVLEYGGGEKEDGVVSDSFKLHVTVLPDERVVISVDTLEIVGREGDTGSEYFSVFNLGNAELTDLELVMMTDLEDESGTMIPRDRIKFTDPLIDTLAIDGCVRVLMSVDVPKFTMEGAYLGEFEVRDEKDGEPSYRSVVKVIVSSATQLTYDENPVTGDRVMIRCKGDDEAFPCLTILNIAGEIVRYQVAMEISTKEDVPTWTYEWMLDNESGKKVAFGTYIVLVETVINGEDKVLKDKILVIR